MPISKMQSADRVDFETSLTLADIHQLSVNSNLRTLQCCSEVQLETWDLINNELLTRRPDINLRLYGFYSSICDLSFVTRLKNVRHFSADCLRRAVNVESMAALPNLESLSIGVFELESLDFLAEIPSGITSLSLGATKSKKPRLNHLMRFRSLKKLFLEAQQAGIEVLSDLTMLEDLRLRSISTRGLDYLLDLNRLWHLVIELGGIRDLSAIQGKKNIKYLELRQIRGLRDISVISSLSNLQSLFLHSLRNVIEIPDLSRLTRLRRLCLENMKALTSVGAILRSPSLREFIHVSARNMKPEQYVDLPRIKTLKEVLVGFGSRRKNQEFEKLMRLSGIEQFQSSRFVFE